MKPWVWSQEPQATTNGANLQYQLVRKIEVGRTLVTSLGVGVTGRDHEIEKRMQEGKMENQEWPDGANPVHRTKIGLFVWGAELGNSQSGVEK